MTQQPGLNLRGAVDLSSFAAASPRPTRTAPIAGSAPTAGAAGRPGAAGAAGAGAGTAGSGNGGPGGAGSAYAVDVTEASFQGDVIELSMTVPVVVDLYSPTAAGGAALSDLLVRLSAEGAGRWVLARIDVTANPRIAQAFGVQGAPAVFAVLKGQPVPLFSEALPEPAVRQYLDELIRVAQANGVSGQVGPVSAAGHEPPVEELVEPELDQAYDAIERDDLDGAAEAYRRLLGRKPADATAQAGLAQVELLRRTRGLDPASVRRDAAEHPDDVASQTRAADLEVLGGHIEDAFARLVELVRRSTGEDRQQARTHLVELFEVIGAGDPRVAKARTALANALF